MRLFITGFGPFFDVVENPSSWLAERSGAPFQILEVSFLAVDDFLGQIDGAEFDALLMLGLANQSEKMRIERVGRNFIGAAPDIRGRRQGPAPIDPTAPRQLSATLWRPESAAIEPSVIADSVDAGDYLCNYALFRSLQSFPEKKVGFLHVAPAETIDLETQLAAIVNVIESITSTEG